MTDTPSGNRWEPTEDDATQPLTPTPHTSPTGLRADPVTEPVTPPEYGWAPVPQPAEAVHRAAIGGVRVRSPRVPPRWCSAPAAGGYAIGSGTAGSGQGTSVPLARRLPTASPPARVPRGGTGEATTTTSSTRTLKDDGNTDDEHS